ncbi:MAG: GNAT family N-acetyltransferase [Burkholderiaceae bacterium]
MRDPAITITEHDDPPAADAAVVDEGIGESNAAAAPLHDVRPLGCFARDASGAAVGGAVGRTWGECAELQQLWVAPSCRGRGIGRALVLRFEQQAVARGCRRCYLETFSFQAPALYRALGYVQQMQIEGFAPGIVKTAMVKELG